MSETLHRVTANVVCDVLPNYSPVIVITSFDGLEGEGGLARLESQIVAASAAAQQAYGALPVKVRTWANNVSKVVDEFIENETKDK